MSDKNQSIYINCISCNKMIIVIGDVGTCILRTYSSYLASSHISGPCTSDMFCFTACFACDSGDNRSEQPMYAQVHPQYAFSCVPYSIAKRMAHGSIDVAIISGRVAFIKRNEIPEIFSSASYSRSISTRFSTTETADIKLSNKLTVSNTHHKNFFESTANSSTHVYL